MRAFASRSCARSSACSALGPALLAEGDRKVAVTAAPAPPARRPATIAIGSVVSAMVGRFSLLGVRTSRVGAQRSPRRARGRWGPALPSVPRERADGDGDLQLGA